MSAQYDPSPETTRPVQDAVLELAARSILPEAEVFHALAGTARRSLTFDDLLEAVQAQHLRGEVALTSLHLSNLSQINDTFGYVIGDQLLAVVALVLDATLACHDPGAVFARMPGARFIVAHSAPSARVQSQRVLRQVFAELRLQHKSVAVTPRARTIDHDPTPLEIGSRRAFLDMLDGKRNKRAEVTSSSAAVVRPAGSSTDEIVEALRSGCVEVHYQPVCNLETGAVYDVEALARLRVGDELRTAGSFIDTLYTLGEIAALDRAVLSRVVEDASRLLSITPKLFVNVSPISLGDPEFAQHMEACLEKLRDAGLNLVVVLELTEQSVIRNVGVVKDLHERLGVTFAIDDFGTGYSSLGLVSELAAHNSIAYLKLDGSLVRSMATSRIKFKVVLAIANLAKSLNLEVIAEYVGDQATVDALRSAGITLGQGFHFSKGLNIDELLARYGDRPKLAEVVRFKPARLKVLEPYLGRAFEAFYDRLLASPYFEDHFHSPEQIESLVERQQAEFVASLADTPHDRRERYARLGRIHHRIGIPPTPFLHGADILHDELIEVLASVTDDGLLVRDTMTFFHELRNHMAWGYLECDLLLDVDLLEARTRRLTDTKLGGHAAHDVCSCMSTLLRSMRQQDVHLLHDVSQETCPATQRFHTIARHGSQCGPESTQVLLAHRQLHELLDSIRYFLAQDGHTSLLFLHQRARGLFAEIYSGLLVLLQDSGSNLEQEAR